MSLFVGTSGWAYKEWKPDFYPADIPQRAFLGHYGKTLSACEINATFYKLQSPETFARWAAETPEPFRFSTKAHRKLTHSKSIAPETGDGSFLEVFLKSVQQLGDRLGVVLFQFPPHRKRSDEDLTALMNALPLGIDCAFEFRNETWEDPEVAEMIAARGWTVCISNTDGTVPAALPPGDLAYVRLRTERYTESQRQGWLELLRREAIERPVYAFSKHEGIPAGDPLGGIGLAQWLVEQTR